MMIGELSVLSEWIPEQMEPGTIFVLENAGEVGEKEDPYWAVLACPSCGHDWEDSVDVGRFLWAEVETLARRVLWEVHTLASAYGWSESDTLSLGAARRAMYLRLVHA